MSAAPELIDVAIKQKSPKRFIQTKKWQVNSSVAGDVEERQQSMSSESER